MFIEIFDGIYRLDDILHIFKTTSIDGIPVKPSLCINCTEVEFREFDKTEEEIDETLVKIKEQLSQYYVTI